jgi:hypothetical protein
MAAQRCAKCGINYPTWLKQCLVCDQATFSSPFSAPDPDWEDVARAKLNEEPDFMFFFVELEVPVLRLEAEAEIVEENGRLFVDHQDLLDAGYLNIETDKVVMLNERFYEVLGRDRTRGKTRYGRWWINEIDPEAEFSDVPVLSVPEPEVESGDEAEA